MEYWKVVSLKPTYGNPTTGSANSVALEQGIYVHKKVKKNPELKIYTRVCLFTSRPAIVEVYKENSKLKEYPGIVGINVCCSIIN